MQGQQADCDGIDLQWMQHTSDEESDDNDVDRDGWVVGLLLPIIIVDFFFVLIMGCVFF